MPFLFDLACKMAILCELTSRMFFLFVFILSQEMAPKKLSTKRSRKDTTGEGSSAALEFDSNRFWSAEHQQRFEAIKGWSFLRERRV